MAGRAFLIAVCVHAALLAAAWPDGPVHLIAMVPSGRSPTVQASAIAAAFAARSANHHAAVLAYGTDRSAAAALEAPRTSFVEIAPRKDGDEGRDALNELFEHDPIAGIGAVFGFFTAADYDAHRAAVLAHLDVRASSPPSPASQPPSQLACQRTGPCVHWLSLFNRWLRLFRGRALQSR
jgi:hypothetical protein